MRASASFSVLFLLAFSAAASAEIHTEVVEYKHGDAVLQGYLAYDDESEGPRPGVLVVHEWKGLGAYAEYRARELAQLGYIAFAADMYGKGVRAKDHEEAGKLSGIYREDRKLMRDRAMAGLTVLTEHYLTKGQPLAAIGYCFGGTTVLELARAGAPVEGVVSFHGGLGTPMQAEPGKFKAKVLALHGADDKFVPAEEVATFQVEMRKAGADWQLIVYGGAVHSFTNPEAGQDPSTGMAYDADADRRSWEAMRQFFDELFL